MLIKIELQTSAGEGILYTTSQVAAFVHKSGVSEGICFACPSRYHRAN